jgi:plasmid stabilization system protein ParE
MATVRLSARAVVHLERIFEFIAARDRDRDRDRALQTVQQIREAVMVLARHPLLGRTAEDGRRELVISHGRAAYLALYRWYPADRMVLVLAVRHAREAGYAGD